MPLSWVSRVAEVIWSMEVEPHGFIRVFGAHWRVKDDPAHVNAIPASMGSVNMQKQQFTSRQHVSNTGKAMQRD